MKKVQSKSILARTLLAAAAFVAAISFNTVTSKAADTDPGFYQNEYSNHGSSWAVKNDLDIASLQGIKKGDKISFKVANKSVCSAKLVVSKSKGKTYYSCYITPNKPGTTNIVCTVKRGKTSYKTTYTYTGVKYNKPIKSLKIGKKDYAKALAKSPYLFGTKLSGKQKITVEASDKYEVAAISVVTGKSTSTKMYNNGDTVNLKNCSHLIVLLKDKTTNEYFSVSIIKNNKKK